MMFGQMNFETVAADLHVQRHIRTEAVLPINLEAKKVHIEGARLGFIEAAENWRSVSQGNKRGPFTKNPGQAMPGPG